MNRAVWIVLVTALVPGCVLLSPSPTSMREEGAELCGNERDDDFDGRVDCAETSCDGLCPEETEAACSDGRDNDGDGVRDGADARCWAPLGLVVRRCSASSPVAVTLEFEDDSALEALELVGGGRMIAVPSLGGRNGVLYVEAAGAGGAQTVALDREIRASWDGITLHTSISIADGDVTPDARVMIALVPEALARSGEPVTTAPEDLPFAIVLDGATATASILGGGARVATPFDATGFVELTVEPVAGEGGPGLGVTVGTARLEPVPVPEGTSGNLRLVLLVEGFAFVDALEVGTTGGRSDCASDAPHIPGADVPFGELGGLVELGAHVSVAATPDESLHCALVMGCEARGGALTRFVRLYRSEDGGRAWTAGDSIRAEGTGRVGAAAVAWDAARGAFGLVLATATGLSPREGRLERLATSDCAAFDGAPSSTGLDHLSLGTDWGCEDTTETLAGVSYLVRASGQHEIWISEPASTSVRLVRASSSDGSTFGAPDEVLVGAREEGLASPILVSAVGRDDLVLVAARPPAVEGPSLRLGMLDADGHFVDVGAPTLLSPSGLAASFDRFEIAVGHLWAGPRTRFLLYGARGDYGAGEVVRPAAAGTALLEVRLPL